MKKIYKRLVILFTILTIVLTGMFVISMIGLKWKQSGKRIQETLQNTKTILQESVEDYYTQEKLIKLDYLNRAEAIDFIIRNNTNMSDAFSLNEVKEALGVNEIYALDESGQIVYSTSKANEKAILEAAQSAVAALHHEEEKRYEYYAEKSEDGKTFVYAGVCLKTEGDEYATLVIDYPVENNGLRMKNEFIEKELKNVATDYNTTVMAIDVKEKELIGVTDKNKKFGKEEIQLTLEKLLQVISSTEEGKVMWFVYDGTVITSVDMNYDDDIILIGIDTGFSVMDDLWMTMLRMVGFSIVIYIIVIAFFNYLIKKLIFEDIEKNKAKIQKIMSGEHDIEFETCKVEEIEELVSTIKQLNHGYIHKTERMNKMFNSISPNIATFELLDENYASFFSDNFECVLGISTEEGHNFRTNAAEFESFITELSKQKDENGMVHFRDKYLKINLFEIADKEKIGVIIDRTNDEEIRRNLEHELKEEQKKNSLDPLTGIMNRKGFRDMVEKLLAHEQEGVLFIFDLDNFKKINDTKGYPEGDKVLRMFAKMLRQEFRKSDLVARIGGDEFMVYIPNQIEDSLMRKKLDSLLYNTQKNYSIYKDYHISVSIGVARINKEAGIADFNSLYETADIALYIAKGLGKNQYYVNKQSIRCVRKECIGCTEGCPRSKILLADKAQ